MITSEEVDSCESCAHFDDGFDWTVMEYIHIVSCPFGSPAGNLEPCKKFHHVKWLTGEFEDEPTDTTEEGE